MPAMKDTRLIQLVPLAKRLGVPVEWLRTEALAGRVPCVNADGRLLFSPRAVQQALVRRAEHPVGTALDLHVHREPLA
jgi:hypothetical protein